ncbi:MAG: agmatine deiminase family protein [Verrucomicrobiae bacterium]|nr:agmatine deiminase family protein [Verrucomicrobiae bacterium]
MNQSENETPTRLGYRMPAEWEPHEATWLSWPRRDGISFPGRFDSIPSYWVRMAELLSEGELVRINVFDEAHEAEVKEHLVKGGLEKKLNQRIFLHRFPAYEPWCRDHGPIFVVKEEAPELAIVDWGYNAWGGKYPPYDWDDVVPTHIANFLKVPCFQPKMILEGGSIDVNGCGSLLTTTSCLLNPNRNPDLSQETIENYLKDYLGVTNILWLGEGIIGDDTDGHVDDITRFVSPTTIVTGITDDPQDPNFEPLMENYRRLLEMKNEEGKPFHVCSLPMPTPQSYEGQPLPASYANFYIGNKVVLVPIYDCDNDGEVLVTLRELFPKRKVHGIDCRDLIWGLGAFHCVTQQQPAIKKVKQ